MKHVLWEAIEAIDTELLTEHIDKTERAKRPTAPSFRVLMIAAALILLTALLFVTLAFGREDFAFMNDEGFYQVSGQSGQDPVFRNDEDLVTVDPLATVPVQGKLPTSITVDGKTLALTDCLAHRGASLSYGLDAPKYTVPFFNDHSRPTVTLDAVSGAVTAIENIAIDRSPGLSKTVDEYIAYAERAILTYLPYFQKEGLSVKNSASMKEHPIPEAYGFILFEYYVGTLRTDISIAVFFGGGTIFSIGIYNYFDLSGLKQDTLDFSKEEHEKLLLSFADYVCGDMEKLSETVSEGTLVMGAKGSYAMAYTVAVTARDRSDTVHSQTFTIEIELD